MAKPRSGRTLASSQARASQLPDGVPHHIAGVYDSVAETLTLYVDGALISSISTAGQTLVQGTEDVFIGDFPGAFVEAFDGDISDVRIWSDVRTTEEIAATFDQSLDGGAANLELHLRFDDDVTDSSGNGRDGVINGSPFFVEGLAPVDPLAFVPAALAATEDTPEAITDLQVSDADPGAILTVTLEATFGGLTLGSTAGLTFLAGGNGDPLFTVQGSVADLNTALATLSYLGDPDYNGPDDIILTVDDGEPDVVEPVSGVLVIPNSGFFFIYDFDTGTGFTEAQAGATPVNAPNNGVYININPNNNEWLATASVVENGVTSFLPPTSFALAGYAGGFSFVGDSIQFNDAITGLTLTYSNPATPTPTGARNITFTFNGLDFTDTPPGDMNLDDADFRMSSEAFETIPVVVAAANDAPVAADDNFTAGEDNIFSADLFADNGFGPDFDIDFGDTFNVTEINGAPVFDGEFLTLGSGANLTIRADGTFDYDPTPAFDTLADGEPGVDMFSYTITDSQGAMSIATATFAITGANDAPVAVDDTITTDENSIVSGDLLADNLFGPDFDIDNGAILAVTEINGAPVFDGEVVPLASGAFLTIRANGTFDFDPAGAFESLAQGQDAFENFTYTLSDEFGATSTATAFVTITGVNDAPTAFDDNFSVNEDAIFSFSLFDDNGFGADFDAENGSIIGVTEINGAAVTDGQTVALSSGALLTIRADGTFDYDANGAFEQVAQGDSQPDIFTYSIADEFGATASATAFVTVLGVNDAPVAADDTFSTDQDSVIAGDLFADNLFGPDADPDDGAVLSVTAINGAPVFDGEPVALPSGAILLIRADGTFDYDPNGAFDNLAEGVTAPDSFTYTVADEFGATSFATANITVFGVNDAPLAFDESYALDEETPLSDGLLFDANSDGFFAFDPDGDPLFVSQINGAPVTDGQVVTLTSGAALTIRADGTFDYDPQAQFETLAVGATGTDSFTFQVDDGLGGVATATAFLNIAGANDAPVAQDDEFAGDEDTPIMGDLLAENGFGADTDIDAGDVLTVSRIDGAPVVDGQTVFLASGAALTISADGSFIYDQQGVFDQLAQGSATIDTFTYEIDDGFGGVSTATASLLIAGVNDQPIAVDDEISANEDAPISGNLLADNGLGFDDDP